MNCTMHYSQVIKGVLNVNKSEVRLLILSTGEHILGTVSSETPEEIVIEHPVSLVPDPNSNGRSMMFIPYLQFSVEESAPFPRHEIRHTLTPQDQLAQGYVDQFAPEIAVPDQSIVDSSGLKLV